MTTVEHYHVVDPAYAGAEDDIVRMIRGFQARQEKLLEERGDNQKVRQAHYDACRLIADAIERGQHRKRA